MRLIDADALVEALESKAGYWQRTGCDAAADTLDVAIELTNSQPTIDPRERIVAALWQLHESKYDWHIGVQKSIEEAIAIVERELGGE